MQASIILPLLLYGGLAVAATWATRHDRCLAFIGLFLLVSFTVSNILWYLGVPAHSRTGIYTALQVLLSISTVCAWDLCKKRILVLLVGVSALSVCANIAFASIISPTWSHVHMWEVFTNLCYAAECLLTIWGGVSHGRKLGRFLHWPFNNRAAVNAHARTKGDPE